MPSEFALKVSNFLLSKKSIGLIQAIDSNNDLPIGIDKLPKHIADAKKLSQDDKSGFAEYEKRTEKEARENWVLYNTSNPCEFEEYRKTHYGLESYKQELEAAIDRITKVTFHYLLDLSKRLLLNEECDEILARSEIPIEDFISYFVELFSFETSIENKRSFILSIYRHFFENPSSHLNRSVVYFMNSDLKDENLNMNPALNDLFAICAVNDGNRSEESKKTLYNFYLSENCTQGSLQGVATSMFAEDNLAGFLLQTMSKCKKWEEFLKCFQLIDKISSSNPGLKFTIVSEDALQDLVKIFNNIHKQGAHQNQYKIKIMQLMQMMQSCNFTFKIEEEFLQKILTSLNSIIQESLKIPGTQEALDFAIEICNIAITDIDGTRYPFANLSQLNLETIAASINKSGNIEIMKAFLTTLSKRCIVIKNPKKEMLINLALITRQLATQGHEINFDIASYVISKFTQKQQELEELKKTPATQEQIAKKTRELEEEKTTLKQTLEAFSDVIAGTYSSKNFSKLVGNYFFDQILRLKKQAKLSLEKMPDNSREIRLYNMFFSDFLEKTDISREDIRIIMAIISTFNEKEFFNNADNSRLLVKMLGFKFSESEDDKMLLEEIKKQLIENQAAQDTPFKKQFIEKLSSSFFDYEDTDRLCTRKILVEILSRNPDLMKGFVKKIILDTPLSASMSLKSKIQDAIIRITINDNKSEIFTKAFIEALIGLLIEKPRADFVNDITQLISNCIGEDSVFIKQHLFQVLTQYLIRTYHEKDSELFKDLEALRDKFEQSKTKMFLTLLEDVSKQENADHLIYFAKEITDMIRSQDGQQRAVDIEFAQAFMEKINTRINEFEATKSASGAQALTPTDGLTLENLKILKNYILIAISQQKITPTSNSAKLLIVLLNSSDKEFQKDFDQNLKQALTQEFSRDYTPYGGLQAMTYAIKSINAFALQNENMGVISFLDDPKSPDLLAKALTQLLESGSDCFTKDYSILILIKHLISKNKESVKAFATKEIATLLTEAFARTNYHDSDIIISELLHRITEIDPSLAEDIKQALDQIFNSVDKSSFVSLMIKAGSNEIISRFINPDQLQLFAQQVQIEIPHLAQSITEGKSENLRDLIWLLNRSPSLISTSVTKPLIKIFTSDIFKKRDPKDAFFLDSLITLMDNILSCAIDDENKLFLLDYLIKSCLAASAINDTSLENISDKIFANENLRTSVIQYLNRRLNAAFENKQYDLCANLMGFVNKLISQNPAIAESFLRITQPVIHIAFSIPAAVDEGNLMLENAIALTANLAKDDPSRATETCDIFIANLTSQGIYEDSHRLKHLLDVLTKLAFANKALKNAFATERFAIALAFLISKPIDDLSFVDIAKLINDLFATALILPKFFNNIAPLINQTILKHRTFVAPPHDKPLADILVRNLEVQTSNSCIYGIRILASLLNKLIQHDDDLTKSFATPEKVKFFIDTLDVVLSQPGSDDVAQNIVSIISKIISKFNDSDLALFLTPEFEKSLFFALQHLTDKKLLAKTKILESMAVFSKTKEQHSFYAELPQINFLVNLFINLRDNDLSRKEKALRRREILSILGFVTQNFAITENSFAGKISVSCSLLLALNILVNIANPEPIETFEEMVKFMQFIFHGNLVAIDQISQDLIQGSRTTKERLKKLELTLKNPDKPVCAASITSMLERFLMENQTLRGGAKVLMAVANPLIAHLEQDSKFANVIEFTSDYSQRSCVNQPVLGIFLSLTLLEISKAANIADKINAAKVLILYDTILYTYRQENKDKDEDKKIPDHLEVEAVLLILAKVAQKGGHGTIPWPGIPEPEHIPFTKGLNFQFIEEISGKIMQNETVSEIFRDHDYPKLLTSLQGSSHAFSVCQAFNPGRFEAMKQENALKSNLFQLFFSSIIFQKEGTVLDDKILGDFFASEHFKNFIDQDAKINLKTAKEIIEKELKGKTYLDASNYIQQIINPNQRFIEETFAELIRQLTTGTQSMAAGEASAGNEEEAEEKHPKPNPKRTRSEPLQTPGKGPSHPD